MPCSVMGKAEEKQDWAGKRWSVLCAGWAVRVERLVKHASVERPCRRWGGRARNTEEGPGPKRRATPRQYLSPWIEQDHPQRDCERNKGSGRGGRGGLKKEERKEPGR